MDMVDQQRSLYSHIDTFEEEDTSQYDGNGPNWSVI